MEKVQQKLLLWKKAVQKVNYPSARAFKKVYADLEALVIARHLDPSHLKFIRRREV